MITAITISAVFFILLLYANFVQNRLTENLKSYAPIVAISLITTVTYVLSFLVDLTLVQILLLVIALVMAFIDFKSHRQSLQPKMFFNRHKFIIISAAFLILTTYNAQIALWDEFFWAGFTKHLFTHDTYWNSAHELINARYLPGLSLWERLFVVFEFNNEQSLFFALGIIFFSTWTALKPNSSTLKQNIYFGILFIAISAMFSPVLISSVYVDTTTGVWFAVLMCAIASFKDKQDILPVIAIALFLAIIKETAFLLSLLCMLMLGIKLIRLKLYKNQKTILIYISGLALILLNFIIWQQHLKSAGLASSLFKDAVGSILSDLQSPSERAIKTLSIFYENVLTIKFPRSTFSNITDGNLVINFVLLIPLLFYFRQKYEFVIGYIFGFIGYTATVIVFWLYLTSAYEGYNLASYDRYFGVFFLGFALLVLKLAFDQKLNEKRYFSLFFYAFLITYPPKISSLHPANFKHTINDIGSQIFQYQYTSPNHVLNQYIDQINLTAENDCKIWMIWQYTTGFPSMVSRYKLNTCTLKGFPWSIGQPQSAEDVWTKNLTDQEIREYLKEVDYVGLGRIDSQFTLRYGHFFEQNPENLKLYKLNKNTFKLEIVNLKNERN